MARPRKPNARPRSDRVKRFVKGMNAVKKREDGLQTRMWAMRRWLAKEHPPLQEHAMDMLMPDMRLSRRWTQEDEDQLLADWEEDPFRLYLEQRHINSLKDQLTACKRIASMYHCLPERILSRETWLEYEPSASGVRFPVWSTTFCKTLARVASHPFFQYEPYNLATAIQWAVIVRTNDRGPWTLEARASGDAWLEAFAEVFVKKPQEANPEPWFQDKVKLRRSVHGNRSRLPGLSVPELGTLGRETHRSGWCRFFQHIEHMVPYDRMTHPLHRGVRPFRVRHQDLEVLSKALEYMGGYGGIPGPWDVECWYQVTGSVINSSTAPSGEQMKEVIAAAALNDKRLRRYFARNPRWPSYQEGGQDRGDGSPVDDVSMAEGESSSEDESSSDDDYAQHAGAHHDVASSMDESSDRDTENAAEDDEDEPREDLGVDEDPEDGDDEQQEEAEEWDQPPPFFSDDSDREGDDGEDKEEEDEGEEEGEVEEDEESEGEESELGVTREGGTVHCLDVDLSETTHQSIVADSQGERWHRRGSLAQHRDTETVIPDSQGEKSSESDVLGDNNGQTLEEGTDGSNAEDSSDSGHWEQQQDEAQRTVSPESDVAVPAESEDDEHDKSVDNDEEDCSWTRKAPSDATSDDDEASAFALCQGFPQYGIPPLAIQPRTRLPISSVDHLRKTLALWKDAGQDTVSRHGVSGKRRQTDDTAIQGPAKRHRFDKQCQRAGSESIGKPGRVSLEVRITSKKNTPTLSK